MKISWPRLKAIRNIKAYPKRIESYAEARSIPTVGHKTALKVSNRLCVFLIMELIGSPSDNGDSQNRWPRKDPDGDYGRCYDSKAIHDDIRCWLVLHLFACPNSKLTCYLEGPNIAYSWYAMGLRTLEDVRSRKYGIKLSSAQEVTYFFGLSFLFFSYDSPCSSD
jgi:DNA polymerase lambda